MSNLSKFVLLKPTAGLRSPQPKAEVKQSLALAPSDDGAFTGMPSGALSVSRGRVTGSKTKSRGRKGKTRMSTNLPPTLQCTVRVRHKYRFVATATITNTAISPNEIAGICGGICTVTNSTVVPWASTLRIKRCTIWPAVGPALGQADVTWAADGTLFSRDEYKVDTIPQGVTIDKCVTSVPPPGTLGKFWQAASGTNSLMTVSMPSGSILDLQVEYTISNQVSPGTDIGVATGVLGTVYYLPLDGPGANKIVPVGLPTTH